ncbi:MAG: hypothetical protein LBS42_02965 [Tannerella sp.]|jgi:hypothetical protein|nr:hypothetical protein [Tannerella sp.]
MIDKQIAKQTMLEAVVRTLDEFEPLYAHIPVFAGTVKDLKNTMKDIETEALQQSAADLNGATAGKQDVETALVNQTVTVAGILSVLAADTKNGSLAEKVRVTKSMMYQRRDNEALGIARRVHAEALANARVLTAYGVSQDLIYMLETAIARYEILIATAESKQTAAGTDRFFAETDTLLNDRLDKLMRLFKQPAPDFYAAYFNARNIISSTTCKCRPAEDGQVE